MNDLKNMKSQINDFENELKRLGTILDKMKNGFKALEETETIKIGDYGTYRFENKEMKALCIGNTGSIFYFKSIHQIPFTLFEKSDLNNIKDFKKIGNVFDLNWWK